MKDVLVVGAGPTGLVSALILARRGIAVTIIDRKSGPTPESRAMGVHARTLEFYRQLQFGDAVAEQGVQAATIHVRAGDHDTARFSLAEMGAGLSPYPFLLCFAQDQHERFLLDRLVEAGVSVHWGVELQRLIDHGDGGVEVHTGATGSNEPTERYRYVVGCDGAHGRVRECLGIGFPGGTSDQLFYVADAAVPEAHGNDVYVSLSTQGVGLMMPVRSTGTKRLIGLAPSQARHQPVVKWNDVAAHVQSLLGLQVDRPNWFSTYRVHHRVASHFRRGRVFIAGDAGHIHSPTGGQGMNTGIGDAVNLSWKLAEVLHERADSALLDTYEQERIPFARALIATTDRVFQFLVDEGRTPRLLRSQVAPRMLSLIARFAVTRRVMFKALSQIQISYHDCAFNTGKAGRVRGGDRLPWIPSADGDNFEPLRSLSWQLHVYGQAHPRILDAAEHLALATHQFNFTDTARRAGVARNAAYLVRPDGYVAVAMHGSDPQPLTAYVQRWGLRFDGAPPPTSP